MKNETTANTAEAHMNNWSAQPMARALQGVENYATSSKYAEAWADT